jgi:hypothetical protein
MGSSFDPGWPRCAVCGTPVERCERDEDDFLHRLRVRVYCHGESETVDIAEDEVIANPAGIKFGDAFSNSPRALPPRREGG